MKFIIDDNEIKTVNKNAAIQGAMNLVARCASFSYICIQDGEFKAYKAKINSNVLIKNDNNENIFKGRVTSIYYNPDDKTVQIQAEDMLSLLTKIKISGRFKENIISFIKNSFKDISIIQKIIDFLNDFLNKKTRIPNFNNLGKIKDKINIVSLGGMTIYDILQIAVSKMHKTDFKIYLTGNSEIKFLIPSAANAKKELIIGKNVLSASFCAKENDENIASIKAIGDDSIVSGTTVKLIDLNNGAIGYFTVEKDKHVYSDIYTMDLELKERKFDL